MSKGRPGGMTCSQRLRHYDLEFLRAMFMIVAIEERKRRETAMKMSKRRSSGTTCCQRLRHYASEILREIFMIVTIEDRKGTASNFERGSLVSTACG